MAPYIFKQKLAAKKKRVAIVGAGITGLVAISAVKEEGLEPVCFEATDGYGGLWNFREESKVGYGSVMTTTVLNQSKEMGAISNFPPRKEFNNYMRHKEVYQYFKEYCQHFELDRHIHFNHEVIKVKKAEDYDETGRFTVTVKNKVSGEVSTDIYDVVMIASGHFVFPKIEKFPGLEKFKGKVIHTHSLKRVDEFVGQNVLVIGTGCSGLDAAEVSSSVAKQVYISARSGLHVLSRLGPNGYPVDYVLLRRYLTFFLDILPLELCSWYLETFYMDTKFDRSFYYAKPKCCALAKDPIVSDGIHSKISSGSVLQKGMVKYFTENGVLFEGEENITGIDVVIMATGYRLDYPFLEDGLLEIENGMIKLYKCMYPVQLPHSSLVFLGFMNPIGPGYPISEIQARWAAHIAAGKQKLPSNAIMLKDAIRRHRKNERRFIPSEFQTVRVDFVGYLDEIASELGCKPKLLKYLFTDFPLFVRLLFGPSLSYQYRLEGPHKWEGARKAIMTVDDRVHWPLSKENRKKKGVLQLLLEYIIGFVPKNIFIR